LVFAAAGLQHFESRRLWCFTANENKRKRLSCDTEHCEWSWNLSYSVLSRCIWSLHRACSSRYNQKQEHR